MFSNAQYGLQRVYSLLNEKNLDGVNSTEAADYSNLSYTDIPFAQFIQQNKSNIDTNSDDNVSQEEISNLLSAIQSEGLTYSQIVSLSSTGAIDQSLVETVLSNFNKIDANHDGKVSQSEINSYNLDKEIDEKKSKYTEFKANNISIMYGDSSTEETSSVNNSDSEDESEVEV